MVIREKVVGHREFNKGTIDITDPCYDKETWCRLNNVPVKKGGYRLSVWMGNALGEDDIANLRETIQSVCKRELTQKDIDEELCDIKSRVFCIEIKLKGRKFALNSSKWKEIGSIGVDAGLAGFFPDKPDFDDSEWHIFCEKIFANKHNWYNDQYGFYCQSGYGDGGYAVSGIKEGEEYIALKICF